MKEIKLYRSQEVDEAWQKRKSELIEKWHLENPEKTFTHLFDVNNGTLHWLKTQNVPITINLFENIAIIKNDYKYIDCIEHYTFIPLRPVKMNNIIKSIEDFINQKPITPKNYAIVKKDEGSINFPHWHLLIY
jgi:hypothetical protein